MSVASRPLASFKPAFAGFLGASPRRLHFAAHSHHAWPDCTRDAQESAWRDAAARADLKWEKVFGEVIPAAQAHVARQLRLPDPATVVFAPSTHDLVTRILSCFERPGPIRVLTTDAEFHSVARQLRRLEEAGRARVERVPVEPFGTFATRFEEAATREQDLVYVSHVFFDSGFVLEELARVAERVPRPETFVVVDGYHAFMARPVDLSSLHGRVFFLAGGYKYAMAGEGACFAHCPDGYGERPVLTGWFAGFEDLESGVRRVSYPRGGGRFLGATFDPVGLYRFNAVQEWLLRERVTPADIHARAVALAARFLAGIRSRRSAIPADRLIPPESVRSRGNFLTFRFPEAADVQRRLLAREVVTDLRGDRLRVGFGLYQDEADVDALLDAVSAI